MGGANSGALASSLAADAYLARLRELLTSGRKKSALLSYWMREACSAANTAVYDRAVADAANDGMGTTLVSAVILGRQAEILNVGDSRAYLIRGDAVTQITRDHSMVMELVALGELTPEQAAHHPNRNLITRAVGVEPTVEADVFSLRLRRGDRLLLCSDGLSGTLSEETLCALSRQSRDAAAICRSLVDRAVELGARDNVTAAVAVI